MEGAVVSFSKLQDNSYGIIGTFRLRGSYIQTDNVSGGRVLRLSKFDSIEGSAIRNHRVREG